MAFYATLYHRGNDFRMRVANTDPERNDEELLAQLRSEGYQSEEFTTIEQSKLPLEPRDTQKFAIKSAPIKDVDNKL
jgi:hypothetical protein